MYFQARETIHHSLFFTGTTYEAVGHEDGWWSAGSTACLPWQILAQTNAALEKMELTDVLMLKFLSQCIVSWGVIDTSPRKHPSLGLNIWGVSLDMSVALFIPSVTHTVKGKVSGLDGG